LHRRNRRSGCVRRSALLVQSPHAVGDHASFRRNSSQNPHAHEADINKIDIKKKGGEEVTLTKDNGGNWKVIAPKPLGADQSAVSSMLSSLSSLNSDRLVEEKASNFNQYGLSEPTLQIGVTEKNSKTHQ